MSDCSMEALGKFIMGFPTPAATVSSCWTGFSSDIEWKGVLQFIVLSNSNVQLFIHVPIHHPYNNQTQEIIKFLEKKKKERKD